MRRSPVVLVLALAVALGAPALASNFPSAGAAFGSLAANVLGGALLFQGSTATNYLDSNDGSTAPVSGAATGRLRYNNATGRWEQSVQTGAYAAVSTLSVYQESISCWKSANQTLTAGSLTAISFDTELFKRGDSSAHDTSTNNSRLYARVAGVYLVQGLALCGSSATQQFQLETKVNGTTFVGEAINLTGNALAATSTAINQVLVLAANDYVELLGEPTLFNCDVVGGDRSYTSFSLTLLAGQ